MKTGKMMYAVATLALLWACDKNATDTTRTTGATVPAASDSARAPSATDTPSEENDNTALNRRDRAGSGTLTPMDQGNSPADLETTQRVRKELMASDDLSTEAKNIKVITSDGVITLRGSVKSQAERTAIEAKVHRVAGSGRVDDQLDVPKVNAEKSGTQK